MKATEELMKLAEAATQGPWESYKYIVEFPRQEAGGFSLRDCPRPEANAEYIAAANPETIKQLIALVRLQRRAVRIEHDDHCNCADHILEAIEAFNKFERGE